MRLVVSCTYVEECAFYLGECTLVQQTATLDRSLREAILDTEAVIDQVVSVRDLLGALNPGLKLAGNCAAPDGLARAVTGEGDSLVCYEALLKSLFASCRATGLCLYDVTRMPLAVLNGALHTHPVVRSGVEYAQNGLYDARVDRLFNPGA